MIRLYNEPEKTEYSSLADALTPVGLARITMEKPKPSEIMESMKRVCEAKPKEKL